MTLESIAIFRVHAEVVDLTERSLRAAGADGYELFVLWSGRVDGAVFEVIDAHVPKQTSYRTAEGLLVRVEGQALHDLNQWLYDNGQVLGVQVHAHPTDAFHSETDDTYPIVSTVGGLSIVAADFCADGLLSNTTMAYRLGREGWDEHDPDRLREILKVT